jgi:hypothetical protein
MARARGGIGVTQWDVLVMRTFFPKALLSAKRAGKSGWTNEGKRAG